MCVRAEYFPEYLARVIKPVLLESAQTSSPRLSVKQTSWDNNERSEFRARNVSRQNPPTRTLEIPCTHCPVYCLVLSGGPTCLALTSGLFHVALSQWTQTYSKSANRACKTLMSLMRNAKKDKQVQTAGAANQNGPATIPLAGNIKHL